MGGTGTVTPSYGARRGLGVWRGRGRVAGAAHLEQRLLADSELDQVLLRQIDARAPAVLTDVAQDVRQLQRDAEGEGGLLQWQHRAAASKSNEQA